MLRIKLLSLVFFLYVLFSLYICQTVESNNFNYVSIYISKSGSDETGNGTSINPYKTIARGLVQAYVNVNFILGDGEYSAILGTNSTNIKFSRHPENPNPPLIYEFYRTSLDTPFNATFTEILLGNATLSSFHLTGPISSVTFENCYIYGSTGPNQNPSFLIDAFVATPARNQLDSEQNTHQNCNVKFNSTDLFQYGSNPMSFLNCGHITFTNSRLNTKMGSTTTFNGFDTITFYNMTTILSEIPKNGNSIFKFEKGLHVWIYLSQITWTTFNIYDLDNINAIYSTFDTTTFTKLGNTPNCGYVPTITGITLSSIHNTEINVVSCNIRVDFVYNQISGTFKSNTLIDLGANYYGSSQGPHSCFNPNPPPSGQGAIVTGLVNWSPYCVDPVCKDLSKGPYLQDRAVMQGCPRVTGPLIAGVLLLCLLFLGVPISMFVPYCMCCKIRSLQPDVINISRLRLLNSFAFIVLGVTFIFCVVAAGIGSHFSSLTWSTSVPFSYEDSLVAIAGIILIIPFIVIHIVGRIGMNIASKNRKDIISSTLRSGLISSGVDSAGNTQHITSFFIYMHIGQLAVTIGLALVLGCVSLIGLSKVSRGPFLHILILPCFTLIFICFIEIYHAYSMLPYCVSEEIVYEVSGFNEKSPLKATLIVEDQDHVSLEDDEKNSSIKNENVDEIGTIDQKIIKVFYDKFVHRTRLWLVVEISTLAILGLTAIWPIFKGNFIAGLLVSIWCAIDISRCLGTVYIIKLRVDPSVFQGYLYFTALTKFLGLCLFIYTMVTIFLPLAHHSVFLISFFFLVHALVAPFPLEKLYKLNLFQKNDMSM